MNTSHRFCGSCATWDTSAGFCSKVGNQTFLSTFLCLPCNAVIGMTCFLLTNSSLNDLSSFVVFSDLCHYIDVITLSLYYTYYMYIWMICRCMYSFICICIRIHMYIHIIVARRLDVNSQGQIYLYIYILTYTCVHMHRYICIHKYIFI